MSDADLPLVHESISPRADDDGPAPSVFVLHGRGADEQDLLPVTRHFPERYHVVSFRAPDALMGGYTWYELDLSGGGLHQSQPHTEEFRRCLDLVWESIEAATDAYGLDPDRRGLFGFSQGAITSLSTLVEHPESVSWVAAHHGYLAAVHADEEVSLDGTPVLVAAGQTDDVIPASRGEEAADRLRELGADVTFGTYPVGHGIGQDELRDLVEFVEAR